MEDQQTEVPREANKDIFLRYNWIKQTQGLMKKNMKKTFWTTYLSYIIVSIDHFLSFR